MRFTRPVGHLDRDLCGNNCIMREGKTVGQLDSGGLLLQGDRRQDNRLQAGDVVLVPAARAGGGRQRIGQTAGYL